MGFTSPSQPRPLLLLSSRPWNSALADRLTRRLDRPVVSVTAPAQLTSEALRYGKAKPLKADAEPLEFYVCFSIAQKGYRNQIVFFG